MTPRRSQGPDGREAWPSEDGLPRSPRAATDVLPESIPERSFRYRADAIELWLCHPVRDIAGPDTSGLPPADRAPTAPEPPRHFEVPGDSFPKALSARPPKL